MHTYPDSREKPRQLLWRTAEYFASTCDADPAYRRYPLPECGPRQTRVRLRIALSGASRSPRHRTATGSFRQAGARPANSAFFRWGLVRVRRLALLSRDFFSATPNHGRGDGNSGPVPSRIFVCTIDTDPRVAPTRATLRRAVLGTPLSPSIGGSCHTREGFFKFADQVVPPPAPFPLHREWTRERAPFHGEGARLHLGPDGRLARRLTRLESRRLRET